MKRIHTAMISFILLILFVLCIFCGCTRSRAEDDYFLTRERETDVITTQSLSGEADESEVILRTQYPVYDPSCEYVQVIIDNYTDEQVRYGEHWKIDQKIDGEWQPVESRITASTTSVWRGRSQRQRVFVPSLDARVRA